jgi:hypothetical protein
VARGKKEFAESGSQQRAFLSCAFFLADGKITFSVLKSNFEVVE